MKKITLLIVLIIIVFSCKETKSENQKNQIEKKQKTNFVVTDSLLNQAVIYEANIRQYSKKGDFNSFTKDIPQLKKLGIKIIWLMPIYPISKVKRKATGDTFVEDIKNPEERKKYLGSPYAVANYTAINPDFGDKKDLQQLIETAHKNGMAVILDWVANHTGWDNPWIKEHPEFYTKNKKGEITDPLNPDGTSKGWQDVADLNYDNPELRKAMTQSMKYWIKNFNIDGFRCDVAGEVPVDFWKQAITELRQEKPLFMLAEAWEPELLKDHIFDACYGWESHFLLADIAKGKKNVKDFDVYIKKTDSMYEPDDIIMNFTANHDENSWKGTEAETFGKATETMEALTFMIPGMPLIYSGQEYGLNHRLKFFEKDSIPKTKGEKWQLYQKLGFLKNHYPALAGGKQKAKYQRISTTADDKILAFKREKNGKILYFVGNLSNENQKFNLDLKGLFTDKIQGKNITFETDKPVELKAWEYYILE